MNAPANGQRGLFKGEIACEIRPASRGIRSFEITQINSLAGGVVQTIFSLRNVCKTFMLARDVHF